MPLSDAPVWVIAVAAADVASGSAGAVVEHVASSARDGELRQRAGVTRRAVIDPQRPIAIEGHPRKLREQLARAERAGRAVAASLSAMSWKLGTALSSKSTFMLLAGEPPKVAPGRSNSMALVVPSGAVRRPVTSPM